ncbi:nucleotide disphospho-sugar-binding domain-containing protein [Streptomyces broussonetiae]|uniref:nucleotide disphospho-sugar-binding domain-containing protein n=1 Tax=Streptomyces broussonetiae TaxID=2686304 RepID=UPI002D80DB15|nr:nucleotide disphospho-sugar-binding domain-containing protein [Streptomyces broussonetiae]
MVGYRMRILFIPASAPSHYFPIVPLIWACRTAGHDVCVAAQPWGESVVVSSGVPMVTIAKSFDMTAELARHRERGPVATEPGAPNPLFQTLVNAQIRFAAEAANDVVSLVRDWRPDLVVADPLVLAAPLAAAAADVPLVHHLWGPDLLRASEYGYPGSGMSPDAWPEPLCELYARHGCAPRAENAVATVDPWLEAMQIVEVPSRIPVRFVPYNGSNVLPAPVLAPSRRRRVLVTWGSMLVIRDGIEAFPVADVVKTLHEHDTEIVLAVTSADRSLVPSLPSGVTVVENVPLNAIMPSCDAVVHHGGAGTIMTAAYYGVPQLGIPATRDVQTCCSRLADTGAGISVHNEEATVDALSGAIATVLTSDRVGRSAAALRAEVLAQPAPAEVVARLSALAAGGLG